jgi:hypothetical protein
LYLSDQLVQPAEQHANDDNGPAEGLIVDILALVNLVGDHLLIYASVWPLDGDERHDGMGIGNSMFFFVEELRALKRAGDTPAYVWWY